MITIEELLVKLKAQNADFNKKLADSTKATKDFESKVSRSITATMAKFAKLAASVFAVKKSIDFLLNVTSGLDKLAKTASKLGMTVESLSALQFAAEKSGIATDTLTRSIQTMERRIAEASAGMGEAVKAFKILGISADDLKNKTPSEALAVMADALSKVTDQNERARAAMMLFGESGVAMLNMLKDGSAGLKQYADEAAKFGAVVSTEQAKAAEEFNDRLTELKTLLGALSRSILSKIIPALNKFLKLILDAKTGNIELSGSFKMVVGGIKLMTKALIPVGRAIDALVEKYEALNNVSRDRASRDSMLKAEAVMAEENARIMKKYINEAFRLNLEDKISKESYMKWLDAYADEFESKYRSLSRLRRDYAEAEDPTTKFQMLIRIQRLNNELKAVVSNAYDNLLTLTDEVSETIKEIGSGGTTSKTTEKPTTEPIEKPDNEKLEMVTKLAELEVAIEKDSLDARLQNIRDFYAERINLVRDGYEEQLVEGQKYNEMMSALESERYQAIQRELQMYRMYRIQGAREVTNALATIARSFAKNEREMFEINKAARYVDAVINTSTAVTRALAAYPPPMSQIMAGLQFAAGMAQIAAISRTRFGGGGALPPAPSGATPSSASVPGGGVASGGQPMQQIVNISLQGESYNAEQVRALIEAVNDQIGDGVTLAAVREV